MNRVSIFRTPEPKRNHQRPPKKGHKAEQDNDMQGVGVIGEVTESFSTSNDPSLMRANAATRHERSSSSEPYTHLEHGSSEQAEDAQSQPQVDVLRRFRITCLLVLDPKIGSPGQF